VSFESVARTFAAVGVVVAGVFLALPGCSSDPPAAGASDFCGIARSSTTKCVEPNACDMQIAGDCASLPKVLTEATVAAAKDCLESGICGVSSCISRASKGSTPTGAHKKLAEDFCKFCAPNLADCLTNFYKRGSNSAGLIVLPYAEEIATAVDDECTGQDGCQAKFTTCASDVIARTVADRVDPATADCVVQSFVKDEGEVPVGPDGKPQVVTCTPANCTGCCRDDKCEKGDVTSACGAGAKACEICSATSTCTAGVCKEPCGPNTCQGCCEGDTCVDGTAKDTCGDEGGKCSACGPQFGGAGVCSNHSCIDGSCQATCTNGCCSATGCQPGNTAKACGTGGEGCIDCGVGRTCSAAACQLDRTSLWDVYISFAVVPDLDSTGASWDVLAGAPDPYLKVFTSEGASVHSGQTTVLTDSTIPFWAETPVKGVKASELLANTSVELWDSDGDFFDDRIGGCQLPLTAAIFDGSLQNHVCPASATTVSVTVYYRINPHVP
jgi:hypothetical protein